MSATPDSTLANPEQRIADLERQLAEALEQQTATGELLEVINSSPGDLAPVFDAMLEKAMRLCEAAFGALWTYDGEYMHSVATRGVPRQMVEFLRQGPHRPASVVQRTIIAGAPYEQIIDLRLTDGYRANEPIPRAGADLGGVRTLLGVSLRKDDRLIGILAIFRQEVCAFSEKQIALLQNFAAQAVIAMENARLITETREALEQQTATAEVLGVINSSPGDLAPVFDAMLDRAMVLCGFAHGTLQIYDGDQFCAVAIRGLPEPLAGLLRRGFRLGPKHPMRRLLDGARFVQIPDLTLMDDPEVQQQVQVAVEAGSRTLLCVPLRKDDVLLGQIVAVRREVKPFSDKQIALLENFAAQAVIAMENARLLTETRQALDQQTATAEVLGVINSSPGNLTPVFDAMLEKVMRLCEAAFGIMLTYNGQQFHHAAVQGVPDAFAEHRRRNPSMTFSLRSNVGQHLQGENVVQIVDLEAEDHARTTPQGRALLDLGGARTLLSAALRKDGSLLGVLSIYRQEVRPFSEKQIALLENFAAQAVIAMENARLITETREALEQQTATAEVLQVINSSPGDLKPVFEAMLEKAHSLCGADYGSLLTYDGELLWPIARHGASERLAETLPEGIRPWAGGGMDEIVRGAPFAHIHDMTELAKIAPDDAPPRTLVEIGGIRTQLMVPLRKDNALLGVITANRRQARPFSDKEIALLQNFAAQAVIAMENARLLGELRERTEEVTELNRGLEARVAAQVDELGRVGRLKRFLAPQLAELIVSQGDEKILESHRREIVVVFCDLRGYTAFTETAEPEEVLDFLREYHGALGPLVSQFEGTLDQFSGDGIMVFFNDPVPCCDPAERAVRMTLAMREAAAKLIAAWRRRGRELGFGAGIAQGYATLGQIGFAERSGYTAIGTVCNVAARLCAEARDGQILLSQRVAVAVEGTATLEEIGALTLKGLTQPVVAYNVLLATSQPALRVIEGGPQSV